MPNVKREMETGQIQPVRPERYDEAYFLGACKGYTEFIASEGAHLSRRLIGLSKMNHLLLVASISARKATNNEQRFYEEEL
ncbi:MAG: hypothetical protein KKC18_11470 [Chloroflexi bacterium]|nr:hypothetical protein [Chloroflexota bacterium]